MAEIDRYIEKEREREGRKEKRGETVNRNEKVSERSRIERKDSFTYKKENIKIKMLHMRLGETERERQ